MVWKEDNCTYFLQAEEGTKLRRLKFQTPTVWAADFDYMANLFKYIHKGDDQVTALLKERDVENDNNKSRNA